MVTMVYEGARTFASWAMAMAYALAPVATDPDVRRMIYGARRTVMKAPNGRWMVVGTERPTRYRARCDTMNAVLDCNYRCALPACHGGPHRWSVQGTRYVPSDPCAGGCSDPEMHAEGGHEV
jgi:hypothetical protein